MKQTIFSRILTVALYAIFALGAVAVITLPWSIDLISKFLFNVKLADTSYRGIVIAFLYVLSIPCFIAVYEMIRMMRTIKEGPFRENNVKTLRKIGLCFFIIAFLLLGFGAMTAKITYVFAALIATLFALFGYTLAGLFKQAVDFKDENDLTI